MRLPAQKLNFVGKNWYFSLFIPLKKCEKKQNKKKKIKKKMEKSESAQRSRFFQFFQNLFSLNRYVHIAMVRTVFFFHNFEKTMKETKL